MDEEVVHRGDVLGKPTHFEISVASVTPSDR